MRWPRILAWTAVVALGCSAFAQAPQQSASLHAAGQDPLLFYVSFDKGFVPEKAVGGPDIPFATKDKAGNVTIPLAPGKVGNCVSVAKGQQLVYEAEGNSYVAAGTVSFFWRPDADLPKEAIIILDMSGLERNDYSRFFKLSYAGDTLSMWCTLGFMGKRHGFSAGSIKGQIRKGEWHHIAIAWDQTRGVALYMDGKVVGEAKLMWIYEGNFNHFGFGMETRPDFRPGGSQFSQSYDEFRVYDRWLDDGAIQTLAQGQVPKVGDLDAAPYLAHKRTLYGWDNAADLRPAVSLAPEAKGIGLKQIGIERAVDVKRACWLGFDGERARSWPGGAGYFDAGLALDFQIYPAQKLNVIQILAGGPLTFAQTGADGKALPLCEVTDKMLGTTHAYLETPAAGEKFSVQRPRKEGGRLYEMNLFETAPFDGDALKGVNGWERHTIEALSDAETQSSEMTWIRRNFYTPDQETFSAASPSERLQAGSAKFPAMRTVHLLGPEHKERQGLGAIALDLVVKASSEPNVLRVDVMDPLNPERFATTADIRVTGDKGQLRVLLDTRDMILLPGARPRIALTFRSDTEVEMAQSTVAWKWMSVEAALPEHYHDQLARAKDIFQEVSESRPWGYPINSLKTLRFLLNGLDDLHTLAPKDQTIDSYWHWVHPGEQKMIARFPEAPPGIPAWAVYLDQAIDECKKMPYWWIANRENTYGEFGPNDGINDDTDLVGDWWALYLMRGPDKVLFDSMHRVAENSWYNCMNESGLGRHTDALHTYEDGPNTQCQMACMDYGNPVRIERLLVSIRHYKEMLAVGKDGHPHFKGAYYGHDSKGNLSITSTGSRAHDVGDNALALQPAMIVGWYNGDAYCKKTVTDWTDGMMALDMSEMTKNKRLVSARINMESGAVTSSDSYPHFGYGFFSAPWACYEFTGDKKYLDFIKLGMARDVGDYRHIRQTDPIADRYIQETGDTSLKDRFLAATKEPYLWKSSIHNDDYLDIGSFYYAWQCTGDLRILTEGVKLTLNDILWELPMLTVGEQSTDRVWLPQRLINKVVCGGAPLLRNELYPKHALSWENATGRVAPMVKMQDAKQFQTWVVNIDDKEVTVNMRIWRLDHGMYELTQGLDKDQRGVFDGPTQQRTLELARFDLVPLTLPPRSVSFVTCKQIKPLDDIRQRPDLAVCTNDIMYDAKSGALTVRVHNIGSKPTGPYTVRIRVGEKVALEKEAPSLDTPTTDEMPKVAEFRVSAGAQDAVTVELDPERKIPEITKTNNVIQFVPAKLPPPWPITYER